MPKVKIKKINNKWINGYYKENIITKVFLNVLKHLALIDNMMKSILIIFASNLSNIL